jgi:hypothetical protein
MSRNVLVATLGMLVFLVVAGAVYLEIAASARATDVVWEVTRQVQAGDVLTADNVRQVRLPHSGEALAYYTGDLLGARVHAAHDLAAGTIVFPNDVVGDDLALVNLSLRTPPVLQHGQTIDVYAQVGNQTTIVGRHLMVEQAGGGNCSVWVTAADEPFWITLQAGNVALYAARSSGVGVPQGRQTTQDALAALSGGGLAGPAAPTAAPAASPSPTPVPTRKP